MHWNETHYSNECVCATYSFCPWLFNLWCIVLHVTLSPSERTASPDTGQLVTAVTAPQILAHGPGPSEVRGCLWPRHPLRQSGHPDQSEKRITEQSKAPDQGVWLVWGQAQCEGQQKASHWSTTIYIWVTSELKSKKNLSWSLYRTLTEIE